MIKTVIFDLDGTLYDYDGSHLIGMESLERYCVAQFGIESAEFYRIYQEAYQEMFDRIGSVTAAVHNRLIRFQIMLEKLQRPLFPHAFAMYDAYWDAFIDAIRPWEGIAEWMQELKAQGIQIGIGTNMTVYKQYRKLEKLGLTSLIDWIVTSEEVGCEKPEAKFFRQCTAKCGCEPEECLFVGDSLKNDVEGALAVGMKAAWYALETEKDGCTGDEKKPYAVIRSYKECLPEKDLARYV